METRSAYKNLFGNSEGRRTFGRSRCRGKDNIKINFS
jgi:hypothetical protein